MVAPTGFGHGVDFWSPYFQVWFWGVPLAYIVLSQLFRALGWWNFKLRTMKKGSLVDTSTRASDDMAFEIVAGFCVTYLAAAGFICAFGLFGVDDYPKLALNPYYGYSNFVRDHLVYPMLSYQGWNVFLSIFLDVLRDPFMIGHHIATGLLGYLGLHPYLHYRALFFFGMAEVTNIPLTVYDSCKKMGWKDGPLFAASQATFAISFIIFRLILWPIYSFQFWIDSYELLTTGKDKHSGKQTHSNLVVMIFVLSNLFLTFLQFMWGKQVIVGLMGVLGLTKKSKSKSK